MTDSASEPTLRSLDPCGLVTCIFALAILLVSPWITGPLVNPSMAYDHVFLEKSDLCYRFVGIACWTVGLFYFVCQRNLHRLSSGGIRLRTNVVGMVGSLCWCVMLLVLLVFVFNNTEYPDHSNASKRIHWIPSSLNQATTISWACFYSGLMVFGLTVFSLVKSIRVVPIVLGAIVLNAVAVALVGAFFEFRGSERLLGFHLVTNTSFFGPFQYHNYFVGFNLLGIFSSLSLFSLYYDEPEFDRNSRIGKIRLGVIGFAILLLICVMPMAGSRSGLLLLAPTFIMIAVFAYRRGWLQIKQSQTGQLDWNRIAMLGAFSILIFAACYYFAAREINSRVNSSKKQLQSILDRDVIPTRIVLQRDTLKMIFDRPVWGFGPGNWQHAYPHYESDGVRSVRKHQKELETTKYTGFACNAHNDWLELMANLGLVGFALFVAAPLVTLIVKLRRGTDKYQKFLLFGLCLVALLSCWDAPLFHPANLLLFSFLFVIGTRDGSASQSR